MRRWSLIVVLVLPFVLLAALLVIVWRGRTVPLIPTNSNDNVVAAQAPTDITQTNTGTQAYIKSADGRVEIVTQFLKRHDSPLTPHDYYGQMLVTIADRYGLDYRLLPAMMMQESNLCKRYPAGTYNCLGFGIHERGTLGFSSYEEAFDRAAREIKERYIDIGLTTPELIQSKYTPASNGSWARSVTQWLHEMDYNDRQKGKESIRNESSSSAQLELQ